MIVDCSADIRINEAIVCAETIFPKSEICEFSTGSTNKLTFEEQRPDPGNKDMYENYEGIAYIVRNN